MAAIPEEIITQILYYVPAKSIGRFRSVSKGWLSLLTHPDFIKSHDLNTLNKFHLIFTTTVFNINHPAVYSNSYDAPVLRPSDFDEAYPDLMICGSCNGLVLVRYRNIDYTSKFVLLNPTTKESMQLPEHRSYTYPRAYGLGYDSDTGDFKFVFLNCVRSIFLFSAVNVNIYSLKTNTWRRFESLNDYGCRTAKREGAFVNGFLHWIAQRTVNGFRLTLILAFSLADEKFSEVPLPEIVESTEYLSSNYCHVVVVGGKLAFFHEMEGEIWLMNEYRNKESWTMISLHGIPTALPDGDDKPMVFHHDGKFMVAYKDRTMVYDDEKETFEETVCVWDPKNFKVNCGYVESLVSIASCIEQ